MLHDRTFLTTYLNGEMTDQDMISHFHDGRKSVMKSEGAVYTPHWIVSEMLNRINLSDQEQRLIEPSSGHGSFALPLIRFAKEKLSMSWLNTFHWFKNQVTCVDNDENAVTELRVLVSLLFQREGIAADADDFSNIVCDDGLKVDLDGYDIAIGNPPYIRTQALAPDYLKWLRSEFEIAKKGNIDIYYAFLDRYMTKVDRCVFVIPNGCLKTSGAALMRERVFPYLEQVIDFHSELIFPNARTYTCILVTSKSHSGDCFWQRGISGQAVARNWRSLTGSEIHSAPKVAKSGIATLSDKTFTAYPDAGSGNFYALNGSERFPIEPEILRPFIKVTKIQNLEDHASPDKFLIFPYHDTFGRSPMAEDFLKANFPKAYAYLSTHKGHLLDRDRGKANAYPSWFSYGRKQGLHDLQGEKVIFVPCMIGAASIPVLFDTKPITRKYGLPLFVSGYSVFASAQGAMELLSETFREYVRDNGTPKAGKDEPFYAISAKHVNAFLSRNLD